MNGHAVDKHRGRTDMTHAHGHAFDTIFFNFASVAADELVSAHAKQAPPMIPVVAQKFGDFAQVGVSLGVPVYVVHQFEIVDVQGNDQGFLSRVFRHVGSHSAVAAFSTPHAPWLNVLLDVQ